MSSLQHFRNEELHNAFLSFMKEGIKQFTDFIDFLNKSRKLNVKERLEIEPWKKSVNYKKEFKYDYNYFSENALITNLCDYIVLSGKKSLTSLSEYQECIQLMNKDETILSQVNKPHRIFGLITTVDHWKYISYILSKLIKNFIIFNKFNNFLFDELYSYLETFWYNNNFILNQFSPLYNFFGENHFKQIRFSDSLCIRPMTIDEKEVLTTSDVYHENIFDITRVKYVIEYKSRLPKGFDNSDQEHEQGQNGIKFDSIMASIITTLRLFKPGSAGIKAYHQVMELDLPFRRGTSSGGLDLLGLEAEEITHYYLKKEEINELKKFWKSYKDLLIQILDFKVFKKDKFHNIKIAINRFNAGYHKRNPEDRVLDFVIALEALFSKSDDPTDSITFKIALRNARLLAKDQNERKELYEKIVKLYRIRSDIVHGKHPKPIKFDTRDHLAKSITAYLDLLNLYKLDSSINIHETILDSIDFDSVTKKTGKNTTN